MLSDISRHRRNFILLFVIVLAACTKYDPVLPPIINLESEPSEAYEISFLPRNGFNLGADITAIAQYDIINQEECQPLDYGKAIGGVRSNFSKSIPVKVLQHKDGGYSAVIYKKLIKSENYYGMSTCNWGFTAMRFIISDTKNQDVTIFSDDLFNNAGILFLCKKSKYIHSNIEDVCLRSQANQSYDVSYSYEVFVISNKGDGGH